ncbi:uncharacterized protein LOC123922747 [Trifolium pratense]|uniref:uncharacterized protein LOC123922747 n=1 Tax=Trifolium pratense TaxID=57577 RepID=UPI001E690ED8|nr:uncharacterized protein LOC123922747 [Trifolium pratense]
MKNKLENIWKLMGGIELMDVGNAFYMVKFDGEEDKNKVINEGPWMIYDRYLTVRQWTPNFNASTAKIDKTMAWIRIPSLNLVFYDESVLWAIASMVGNPIKVDLQTLKVARGRFARMCVEVDLTKPVVGRVGINGEWYQVQYEGLHIICTHCGCYGHLMKDCAPPTKQSVTDVHDSGRKNEREKKTSEPVPKSTEPVLKLAEPGTEPTKQVEPDVERFGNNQNSTVANNAAINGEEKNSMEVNNIPNLLHGDWIKVQRKKRNNKSKNHGNNELLKGGQLQQHTKYGFPDKESYLNMKKKIQNEEMDPLIGPNQKAKV